MASVLLHSKY